MYEQQRDQSRTLKDHTPGCEEEEKGERSGGTGESFVNVLLLHIIRSVNSVCNIQNMYRTHFLMITLMTTFLYI